MIMDIKFEKNRHQSKGKKQKTVRKREQNMQLFLVQCARPNPKIKQLVVLARLQKISILSA